MEIGVRLQAAGPDLSRGGRFEGVALAPEPVLAGGRVRVATHQASEGEPVDEAQAIMAAGPEAEGIDGRVPVGACRRTGRRTIGHRIAISGVIPTDGAEAFANLARCWRVALTMRSMRNTMPATDDTLEPKPVPDEEAPSLPKPVQEHLGQKLRAAYYETSDRPAYLGDPAIPPELDAHVRRLEQRERVHVKGIEAVEEALGDILTPREPGPR
jgi:hypothetical protein